MDDKELMQQRRPPAMTDADDDQTHAQPDSAGEGGFLHLGSRSDDERRDCTVERRMTP